MERNAIATSLASSQPTARDVRGQGSSEFAATTRHLDDFAERMRSGRGIALAAEHGSQSIVDSIPAFVVLMTSTCELEHINRPCGNISERQLKNWRTGRGAKQCRKVIFRA
jgi:hypothetical protein